MDVELKERDNFISCENSSVKLCVQHDLLDDFVREVNLQAKALNILEGKDSDNANLCAKLRSLQLLCSKELEPLKQLLAVKRQEVEDLKIHHAKLEELNKHMEYLENNIPHHFTCRPNIDLPNLETLALTSYEDNADGSNSTLTESFLTPRTATSCSTNNGSFIQSPGNGVPSYSLRPMKIFENQNIGQDHYPVSISKSLVHKFCPLVAYLTQEEFNSIPSYLKGRTRLTYDSVNIFIDTFNSALSKKYKLLSQSLSSLKLLEKQLYTQYKMQENKETKGLYFITEEDLKSAGHIKTANTMNSLMSILRFFKRMHEVRSDKIVRFVVNG